MPCFMTTHYLLMIVTVILHLTLHLFLCSQTQSISFMWQHTAATSFVVVTNRRSSKQNFSCIFSIVLSPMCFLKPNGLMTQSRSECGFAGQQAASTRSLTRLTRCAAHKLDDEGANDTLKVKVSTDRIVEYSQLEITPTTHNHVFVATTTTTMTTNTNLNKLRQLELQVEKG